MLTDCSRSHAWKFCLLIICICFYSPCALCCAMLCCTISYTYLLCGYFVLTALCTTEFTCGVSRLTPQTRLQSQATAQHSTGHQNKLQRASHKKTSTCSAPSWCNVRLHTSSLDQKSELRPRN